MSENSTAPKVSPTWATAWVTGASTGIGRDVALLLADRGVRVAISARSAAKLDDVARLRPGMLVVPVDVTDRVAMSAAHAHILQEFGSIDLAILNAGVWDPMEGSGYSAERAAATMAVNYTGIANALEPLITDMIVRRSGHLALVASVAGYRGLPKAIAYAPSKAAVISLAEVLRLDLAPYKIKVSLVNPGFVETPMTAVNRFPMPYIVSSADAAARIVKGLELQKFEIAFPWQLVAMMKLLRILPDPLYYYVVRRFIAKT